MDIQFQGCSPSKYIIRIVYFTPTTYNRLWLRNIHTSTLCVDRFMCIQIHEQVHVSIFFLKYIGMPVCVCVCVCPGE